MLILNLTAVAGSISRFLAKGFDTVQASGKDAANRGLVKFGGEIPSSVRDCGLLSMEIAYVVDHRCMLDQSYIEFRVVYILCHKYCVKSRFDNILCLSGK